MRLGLARQKESERGGLTRGNFKLGILCDGFWKVGLHKSEKIGGFNAVSIRLHSAHGHGTEAGGQLRLLLKLNSVPS